jgi:dimethylglycine dehydrogenase
VTSGAYGYTVGKSLAIGYAREGVVVPGDKVDIYILGKPHAATVLAEPPFDSAGARLRA